MEKEKGDDRNEIELEGTTKRKEKKSVKSEMQNIPITTRRIGVRSWILRAVSF